MIKNIIFDFDGVICESVHIKTEAFYEMYLPYGKEIADKVLKHHLENGGMSRYDKFRYYEEVFLQKKISDRRIEQLAHQFSTLVKQKVIEAPLVKGALDFLQHYSHKYICFIVSATPMSEMKEIAEAKNITVFFQEIFGSPQDKVTWGQHILDKYLLKNKETLFVGDAMNDYIAAEENAMHFLLRRTDDNEMMFQQKIDSIENLSELNLYLKNLDLIRYIYE